MGIRGEAAGLGAERGIGIGIGIEKGIETGIGADEGGGGGGEVSALGGDSRQGSACLVWIYLFIARKYDFRLGNGRPAG